MNHHAGHTDAAPTRTMPDWLGIAACFAAGAFVLSLSSFKLSSVDIGYHVAYGRHFLQTGRIVDLDPFLLPQNAKSFVNANWGSQVVMALAEQAAGAGGLVALRIALIAGIFAGIAVAVRRFTRSWTAVAAAWLIAALGAYERFSMRPELFSYAIIAAMFAVLAAPRITLRRVIALGVLQLLWVNLHSYFLVGLMLTGCRLLGDCVHLVVVRKAPVGASLELRGVTLALALQVAACFINPWRGEGAMFPLRTLGFLQTGQVIGGGQESAPVSSWATISEFHSPRDYVGYPINSRTITAWLVLAIVCAALLLTYLVAWIMFGLFRQSTSLQRTLERACLLALFGAMAFEMRRNIAQFALVAGPLAVVIFAEVARSLTPGRFRRIAGGVLATVVLAVAAWWTVAVIDGRFYFSERRINRELGFGYSDRAFAPGATDWLTRNAAVAPNLFVDYYASSNVLPWLPPKYKLFVDTNTFAYEDRIMAEAEAVGLGQRASREFFTQHGVNAVLLSVQPNTEKLVQALASDTDWALTFVDRHHVVFLRRMPEHVPVTWANKPSDKTLDVGAWIAAARGPARYRAMELVTSANVPIALGWHLPAAQLLSKAIELAPDFTEAWINLGLCRAREANAAIRANDGAAFRRHRQAAIQCFTKALELDPDNRLAQHNLNLAQSSQTVQP